MPNPERVTVTPHVSIIIAGSSTTLNCTAELKGDVDVAVDVFTSWTGPKGTMLTHISSLPAVEEQVSSKRVYTSMAVVDAVRNGTYTCQVTVNSSSTFITGDGLMNGSIMIAVG